MEEICFESISLKSKLHCASKYFNINTNVPDTYRNSSNTWQLLFSILNQSKKKKWATKLSSTDMLKEVKGFQCMLKNNVFLHTMKLP